MEPRLDCWLLRSYKNVAHTTHTHNYTCNQTVPKVGSFITYLLLLTYYGTFSPVWSRVRCCRYTVQDIFSYSSMHSWLKTHLFLKFFQPQTVFCHRSYTFTDDRVFCAQQFFSVLFLLLHFAWGVAEAKCILVTPVCVSVCLSLAAFPHYTTRTQM